MTAPRSVLLLEGPLSPLYRIIGRHLSDAGISVSRINLCAGDWLAYRSANNYRGRAADWPAYVGEALRTADAVLMHSERRPYHREAAAIARRRGIDVLVTELGYLRPDWMTIERNGNSVDSLFPTDPNAIRAIASAAAPIADGVVYPREWGLETRDELLNSVPNTLLALAFPHYRTHDQRHPFRQYAAFLASSAIAGRRTEAARRLRDQVRHPFVFAMQTDTDFQIRSNSPFPTMEKALSHTFASFATDAPPDAVLVVKKHPGDVSGADWPATVSRLADAAGIGPRVHFADGLGMTDWLSDARGLVTVNSSAGLDGLRAGVATALLSTAIFDVPGLVHGGTLGAFWSNPVPPDASLFLAFERALAASVQVRGTIYSRPGTHAAAEAIAQRIADGTVGAPGATAGPPPRLEKAMALGIR